MSKHSTPTEQSPDSRIAASDAEHEELKSVRNAHTEKVGGWINKIIHGLGKSAIYPTTDGTHALMYQFPKGKAKPDESTTQTMCNVLAETLNKQITTFPFSIRAINSADEAKPGKRSSKVLRFIITLDPEVEMENSGISATLPEESSSMHLALGAYENRAAIIQDILNNPANKVAQQATSEYKKLCVTHCLDNHNVNDTEHYNQNLYHAVETLYNLILDGVADIHDDPEEAPYIHVQLDEIPPLKGDVMEEEDLHHVIDTYNHIIAQTMDERPESCLCYIDEILDTSGPNEKHDEMNPESKAPEGFQEALTFPNAAKSEEKSEAVLNALREHKHQFMEQLKEMKLGEDKVISTRTH